ncbi:MAG: FAD-dependent oxidoreductase [Erysipelotrichaceae bacterium]|nr:FAD-dependent oxidoreductase [Erysipelotrichaceae bacterium]
MKRYSIWKDNIEEVSYQKLDQDLTTDVLIIGGGMTGINTLYHLRESNLKVVLVEQNKIGMGVTANSTGKLTYLQDHLYNKLLTNFDFEVASSYLKSQREAIQLASDIIKKNSIDCDLVQSNSYVYTSQDKEIEKLKDLKKFLEKNGIYVFEDTNSMVESKYMIGVEDTYLFHPVKFLFGLLKACSSRNIYEDTSIVKIEEEKDGYVCFTEERKIHAKWIVIATHYPYFNLPMVFPVKASLEKSYLSASLKEMELLSLISYDNPFISIRNYQDYCIYLSNSHKNNAKVDDEKHFRELLKKANDLGLNPEYLWSNIDIMTNDGLPYVGEIKEGLLLGTGYNTWGMTNGILAGKLLSDLILKRKNAYQVLFDPKRVNSSMVIQGVMDGYYSLEGYIKGLLSKSDKISYQKEDGKQIAVYQDEEGEHKVYTKCPHMGCRLIFNEVEKTWDCPCHASRFDIDGKCISGPANRDIGIGENN